MTLEEQVLLLLEENRLLLIRVLELEKRIAKLEELLRKYKPSERAIRNVKVKQKISGQFKSGEDCFSILRSIIDICLKRNVDILFALNSIARLNPAE